jgi:hypothetical protein
VGLAEAAVETSFQRWALMLDKRCVFEAFHCPGIAGPPGLRTLGGCSVYPTQLCVAAI